MKRVIVVEGGVMCGIFVVGVFDKFMEENYYFFDFVVGVLVGVMNLFIYVLCMYGLSKIIIM